MEQTELDFKQADNGDTYIEEALGEVRISVRGLVEFMLRCGDIDNRRQGMPEDAMQQGSRIHRMIQKRMGAEYQAEVSLRYTYPTEQYVLIVEGRADGVIDTGEGVTIDEIKGTYRDVERMKQPLPVHLAQAKCYAYIYALQNGLKEIRVRMSYCNIETENMRYFYEDFTFKQLESWFLALIGEYRKWSDYSWEWKKIRQDSIARLEFPFPYREGQRELAAYVYQTIYHQKKLFLEAPTGVGKTVSTMFPAVKAMGKGMGDKLFYLTAKTITRTVADETIELLRGKGLKFKSVILTAKEKICFMEEAVCNPDNCPYAKGHFDRINDAVYDMLTSKERFSREEIEEYAIKYQVCPFEFGLDMSLFADGIVCDYNYLFDPHVYLRRFFGDSSGRNYLFLIDEAHNLLERGREMYSASLLKERFLELKREIQQTIMSELEQKRHKKEVPGQMTLEMTYVSENLMKEASALLQGSGSRPESYPGNAEIHTEIVPVSSSDSRTEKEGTPRISHKGGSLLVRRGYGENMIYRLEKCNRELLAFKRDCESARVVKDIDDFVNALQRLYSTMSDYLEEQEETGLAVREQILDFYFEIAHFLDIYERVDENYVKYTQMQEDGSFVMKLFCVNPGKNLRECMARGRSSILFSATFLPIQYYKKLLGGEEEDYEVYARSVFNQEKRMLFIANDVTSRYARRSEEEYRKIARYIDEIVRGRHGNYMVFCPSYSFLQNVYDYYKETYATGEKECILQLNDMTEEDREAFLACFRKREEPEHTLIGFCVLGGVFSEGIDLKNDSLIGTVIVGTGIPQVCFERELLKQFFDARQENGFDFAYRYPGMNKVLQAAGRVIRTVDDIGIIALLDERFLQTPYRRLFPREWEYYETVNVETIAKRVERFWDSWL